MLSRLGTRQLGSCRDRAVQTPSWPRLRWRGLQRLDMVVGRVSDRSGAVADPLGGAVRVLSQVEAGKEDSRGGRNIQRRGTPATVPMYTDNNNNVVVQDLNTNDLSKEVPAHISIRREGEGGGGSGKMSESVQWECGGLETGRKRNVEEEAVAWV